MYIDPDPNGITEQREFYAPQDLPPHRHYQDRGWIERALVITRWDETASAKKLLEFPDIAWSSNGVREIVHAIREIVQDGDEVSPILIQARLQRLHPGDGTTWNHDAWFNCWHEQTSNFLEYAGRQKEMLKVFTESYQMDLARRSIIQLGQKLNTLRFLDWWKMAQQLMRSIAPEDNSGTVKTLEELTLKSLEYQKSGAAEKERIPTGFSWLDSVIKGFLPDTVILIGAAPGTGKTSILQCLFKNASKAGHPSHIFQADMPAEEMGERNAIQDIGRPVERFSEDDYKLATKLAEQVRLITVDDRTISLESWESRAAGECARRSDLKLLGTDFAGNISAGGFSAADNGEKIFRTARNMAKDNKACHVILQQPTQEYDREQWPELLHIRGGKFGEIVSHVVMFLHYPWRFNKKMPEDYLQIHVLKNRGGPLAIIPVKWDKPNFSMTQWPGSKLLNPEKGLYCDPNDCGSGRSRMVHVETELDESFEHLI